MKQFPAAFANEWTMVSSDEMMHLSVKVDRSEALDAWLARVPGVPTAAKLLGAHRLLSIFFTASMLQ
jgi:hypothetical protein